MYIPFPRKSFDEQQTCGINANSTMFNKFLQNGTFNETDRICPELTAWKTCHNLRIMHKALAAAESQFLCHNRQHFLAIERGGTFIAESGQKAVRKFYAPL